MVASTDRQVRREHTADPRRSGGRPINQSITLMAVCIFGVNGEESGPEQEPARDADSDTAAILRMVKSCLLFGALGLNLRKGSHLHHRIRPVKK